jgi:hypothetical protein
MRHVNALVTALPGIMQVHLTFELSSVAAATSVAATRQPRDGSAARPWRRSMPPRDLLVLHHGGQLALYVGKQHVVDVVVQLPQGFPAMLGSKLAGAVAALTDC